jgi:hypothetical protein
MTALVELDRLGLEQEIEEGYAGRTGGTTTTLLWMRVGNEVSEWEDLDGEGFKMRLAARWWTWSRRCKLRGDF